LAQRFVYPSTAKNGSGRVLKISEKTTNMVKAVVLKHKLLLNDKLFKGSGSTYGKQFRAVRNKLAEKLQDPSIRQIRLYDLRHCFATMLYHKTRNLLLTKQQIGHRKIETTLIYIQLVNNGSEEFYSATANNVSDALFSWLAFIVLYLAFFGGGLDFWQKMAVFIASGSVLICIIAVMWIKWAMK